MLETAGLARIRFDREWGETLSGTLMANGELAIEYDPARAQIRKTHNGFPAWGVTAYIQFDPGGQLLEEPAIIFQTDGRGNNTAVPLPADLRTVVPTDTAMVEIWFRNWTGADSPAEHWDSDYGRNYRFPVMWPAGKAKISFDEYWGETVFGRPVDNGTLRLEYNPSRAQIRKTHNGFPAWGVTAFVRFNPSGTIVEREAIDFETTSTGTKTANPIPIDISLTIPANTREIEIWFRNWTGADSPREQWDSNYGANYRFSVATTD